MSELENWCNEKGLSQQQKVEIKKHIKKDGGDPTRDKKLFNFLSDKKPSEELASNNYVYISATLNQSQDGNKGGFVPPTPIIQKKN